MAPRVRSFDVKLARISELEKLGPAAPQKELEGFLAEPHAYLVGQAAKVILSLELRALAPAIATTFMRWIKEPPTPDRGCILKNLLVETLIKLEVDAPEVFSAGLRHVQLEMTVGPAPEDVAPVLRGMCAVALVRFDEPGAVLEVTPLLFDPYPEARIGAAEALKISGQELSAGILHAKVLSGDGDSEVLGACYRGLLALSPRRYLPVVGEALLSGRVTAALALGESRLSAALPLLKEAFDQAVPAQWDTILLGVALLRNEEANAYLLSLIATAPEPRAASALGALALHRHDLRLVEKAREVTSKRKSRLLASVFREKMGIS